VGIESTSDQGRTLEPWVSLAETIQKEKPPWQNSKT